MNFDILHFINFILFSVFLSCFLLLYVQCFLSFILSYLLAFLFVISSCLSLYLYINHSPYAFFFLPSFLLFHSIPFFSCHILCEPETYLHHCYLITSSPWMCHISFIICHIFTLLSSYFENPRLFPKLPR